ncbi:MAG: VWA domain-containing protein [Verrucomicrobia bacterium]|nr:VWA domain-containing protein [Verrucomicrobiota bacterium]
MSFLDPFAFAFAAALPVVVVFYLLKRRRTVKLVSSTLLWRKFLAEMQVNAPFQRLRHNWLLLLQLLLLALAVFALARPYFSAQVTGGRLFVVLLDASASMQSTDESGSRFGFARAEAAKLVNAMHDNDQMLVIQAAVTPEVKLSPTSEKAALRRALDALAPADSPTRLADAFKLAESSIKNHSKAEIHVFSDGAVPDLGEFENKALPLVFHRTGQRADNVGITSLDVRANPENAAQRAVFANVVNFSSRRMETEVELLLDDAVVDTRSLLLESKASSPQVFIVNQSRDGVFTVRLTAKDDLAADNQASVVSQLPRPIKVLLVTRGNRFLERALRAVPQLQLTLAADSATTGKGYDFVVLDDVAPSVWPEVHTLAIHTARPNWFGPLNSVKTPPVVDWKGNHPLLRFASFDNVQIAETLAVAKPPWAVALVESPQTPLVLAGELGRQRLVWIGFDTLQSTWPLRVSFPIFIANAAEWLNPASIAAAHLSVRSGDPFRLPLAEPAREAQVIFPDGRAHPLALETNSLEVVFHDTAKQGTYRLRVGANETMFCVNLLDATASDTTPRAELKLGKYNQVEATVLQSASLEIWRWFALAALAVLMWEWWYYHRRTV